MPPSIREAVPSEVFSNISRHLVRSGNRAEEGYPSNEEDEDSITGDLFRTLRRAWSKPISIDGTEWKWRVTTRKFRGRGQLATEHFIGADGIIQLEIDSGNPDWARKGFLFQAKKLWTHRDQDLVQQVQKMESYAPGGSVVFDYRPEAYRAVPGKLVLESEGRPDLRQQRRLGEFLADQFLECFIGRTDTYFDWTIGGLILTGTQPQFTLVPIRMRPQFLAAIQVQQERVKERS